MRAHRPGRGCERTSARPVSYTHLDVYKRQETTFPYMHRMACTLGLYALLFGLMTSVAVCNGFGGGFVGPYIEAPCCLVLGAGSYTHLLKASTVASVMPARR